MHKTLALLPRRFPWAPLANAQRLIEPLEQRMLFSASAAATANLAGRPELGASFSTQNVGVETDGITYALKGDAVAASLTLTNIGKGIAAGSITAKFYLSGNNTLAGARQIFSQSQIITIASGDSQTLATAFPIPKTAALVVPETYRLFARILDTSAGAAHNLTLEGEPIHLLPKVVNIITPGFLSDQPGGYTTWNQVANELDKTIPANTTLAGDVVGFVEKWPATAGFLQEMEGIAAEELSSSVSPIEGALLNAQGANLIASGKPIATRNANAAADSIVAELSNPKSKYYVDPDLSNRTDNPQIIQLIGHSRGAAVNAAAVLGLANLGYHIEDYISLDGYSTDWPGLSGQAGDIPISIDVQDAAAHIDNAINYEVQTGIGPSLSGILDKYARKYLKLLGLTPASLATALADLATAKAPDRPSPPFTNITVQGSGNDPTSNHLNIGQIYADSDPNQRNNTRNLPADQQYILDNFEGENLSG
jgi:hypothetical protein